MSPVPTWREVGTFCLVVYGAIALLAPWWLPAFDQSTAWLGR